MRKNYTLGLAWAGSEVRMTPDSQNPGVSGPKKRPITAKKKKNTELRFNDIVELQNKIITKSSIQGFKKLMDENPTISELIKQFGLRLPKS